MGHRIQEIADRPRRSPRSSCAMDTCRPQTRVRYDDILRGKYHLGKRDECERCNNDAPHSDDASSF